jgi:hypothetical protein
VGLIPSVGVRRRWHEVEARVRGDYVTRVRVITVYYCRYTLQVLSSCKCGSAMTCSAAAAHASRYYYSFSKKEAEVFDPFLVHLQQETTNW